MHDFFCGKSQAKSGEISISDSVFWQLIVTIIGGRQTEPARLESRTHELLKMRQYKTFLIYHFIRFYVGNVQIAFVSLHFGPPCSNGPGAARFALKFYH